MSQDCRPRKFVLRLTYDDLLNLSIDLKKNILIFQDYLISMERKKQRRPDATLYQPGKTRLSKPKKVLEDFECKEKCVSAEKESEIDTNKEFYDRKGNFRSDVDEPSLARAHVDLVKDENRTSAGFCSMHNDVGKTDKCHNYLNNVTAKSKNKITSFDQALADGKKENSLKNIEGKNVSRKKLSNFEENDSILSKNVTRKYSQMRPSVNNKLLLSDNIRKSSLDNLEYTNSLLSKKEKRTPCSGSDFEKGDYDGRRNLLEGLGGSSSDEDGRVCSYSDHNGGETSLQRKTSAGKKKFIHKKLCNLSSDEEIKMDPFEDSSGHKGGLIKLPLDTFCYKGGVYTSEPKEPKTAQLPQRRLWDPEKDGITGAEFRRNNQTENVQKSRRTISNQKHKGCILPRVATDPEYARNSAIKNPSLILNKENFFRPVHYHGDALEYRHRSTKESETRILLSKAQEMSSHQLSMIETFVNLFNSGDSDQSAMSSRNSSMKRSAEEGRSSSYGKSCAEKNQVEEMGQKIWNKVETLRLEVIQIFKAAILADVKLAMEQNAFEALWKSGFYSSIEQLRKITTTELTDRNSDLSLSKRVLTALLTDGIQFYESFLDELQQKYKLNLINLKNKEPVQVNTVNLENSLVDSSGFSTSQKVVLLACHKMAINLGDLERYKELELCPVAESRVSRVISSGYDMSNNDDQGLKQFLQSKWWYLKAQKISPKFGRPFNQLAVISLYMRRKLDAVYFHIRNLASRTAVESAKDQLQMVFHGVWKKADAEEKEKQKVAQELKIKKEAKKKLFQGGMRVEIWVSPDGKEDVDSDDGSKEEDENSQEYLNSMDAIKLNKSFITEYLVILGKLYTKIGMENYEDITISMLTKFRALLSRFPLIMSTDRLLQIVAMNMFIIERFNRNESLQEIAIILGMDMFGLLCESCSQLVGDANENLFAEDTTESTGRIDDLNKICSAIKTWTDWMASHIFLWNPPLPSLLKTFGENELSLWEFLVQFFNILPRLVGTSNLYDKPTKATREVRLLEDEFFNNFVPLLSVPNSCLHVETDSLIKEDRLLAIARLLKIKLFSDVVYGLEPPLISLNPSTGLYKLMSILPSSRKLPISDSKTNSHAISKENASDDYGKKGNDSFGDDDDDDDVIVVSSQWVAMDASDTESTERKQQEVIIQRRVETRGLEIIISPSLLVIDTNCLVDHLQTLKLLMESCKFTVVVPLIVFTELEKLAKIGRHTRTANDVEQNEWIKDQAKMAIRYLEDEFKKKKKKNLNLRLVTSEGNLMNTLAYKHEDDSNARKGCTTNDDLILACCTKLIKARGNDIIPTAPDQPVKMKRNVVLLTNDRLLRIKAIAEDVPARNVPKFMKWAQLKK